MNVGINSAKNVEVTLGRTDIMVFCAVTKLSAQVNNMQFSRHNY